MLPPLLTPELVEVEVSVAEESVRDGMEEEGLLSGVMVLLNIEGQNPRISSESSGPSSLIPVALSSTGPSSDLAASASGLLGELLTSGDP